MPTGRGGMGVAVGGNRKIYAIGGGNYGQGRQATVEEYDPETDTWRARAPMPTARSNLAAVAAANGKIYAIGGCCPPGYGPHLTTVEEYDPAT
ncbi:MAG: galactose oxidase, partial [Chloroflexi bacterium]|nr:galactose oxidase [Chloroflexota bacterium]